MENLADVKQERDALAAALEEAKFLLGMPDSCCGQPWLERVQALENPAAILSDLKAAQRKAGAVAALRKCADNLREVGTPMWDHISIADMTQKYADAIEHGEVTV